MNKGTYVDRNSSPLYQYVVSQCLYIFIIILVFKRNLTLKSTFKIFFFSNKVYFHFLKLLIFFLFDLIFWKVIYNKFIYS